MHFVFLKQAICREQSHPLGERLGNNHPVKRIPVMRRQFTCTQGVFLGDIERLNAPQPLRVGNVFRRRLRKRERAEGELDCDFPCACCRQIQLRGCSRQHLLCHGVESLLGGHAPKEHARVEQVLHAFFLAFLARFFFRPSNRSSKSSGKGASKSSGTVSCPRRIPRTRGDFSSRTGTTPTTRTPPLPMALSSPPATRPTSLDNPLS